MSIAALSVARVGVADRGARRAHGRARGTSDDVQRADRLDLRAVRLGDEPVAAGPRHPQMGDVDRLTSPKAGAERPGTPIGSSRAVARVNGFSSRPAASQTLAAPRSTGRASFRDHQERIAHRPRHELGRPRGDRHVGARPLHEVDERARDDDDPEPPQPARSAAAITTAAVRRPTRRVYLAGNPERRWV